LLEDLPEEAVELSLKLDIKMLREVLSTFKTGRAAVSAQCNSSTSGDENSEEISGKEGLHAVSDQESQCVGTLHGSLSTADFQETVNEQPPKRLVSSPSSEDDDTGVTTCSPAACSTTPSSDAIITERTNWSDQEHQDYLQKRPTLYYHENKQAKEGVTMTVNGMNILPHLVLRDCASDVNLINYSLLKRYGITDLEPCKRKVATSTGGLGGVCGKLAKGRVWLTLKKGTVDEATSTHEFMAVDGVDGLFDILLGTPDFHLHNITIEPRTHSLIKYHHKT
jgi:hypothetical protein